MTPISKTANTPVDLARIVFSDLVARKLDPPSYFVVEQILETLFYTSLHTEEAERVSCSVLYLDSRLPDPDPPRRIRHNRWGFTRLQQPIPFTVANLVKIAKAADPNATSLAIGANSKGRITIWGLIDQLALHFSRMLTRESDKGPEVPGLFHATITGVGEIEVFRRYAPIAVLKQSTILRNYQNVLYLGPVSERLSKFVNGYISDVRKKLGTKLFEELVSSPRGIRALLADRWLGTIARILLAMQRYGHGGALLITPDSTYADLDVKYAMKYSRLRESLISYGENRGHVVSIRDEISSMARDSTMPRRMYYDHEWFEDEQDDCLAALAGSVRFVASLSRVDGLVLLTPNLVVNGFGVVITAEQEVRELFSVAGPLATPAQMKERDPKDYGTRHRSMMRYCAIHEDAVGFVVSQDGYVRVIMKHQGKVMMWDNIQLQHVFEIIDRPSKRTRPVKKKVTK